MNHRAFAPSIPMLFLIIFCNPFHLTAQDNAEAKTLFGGDSQIRGDQFGFFIAPAYGITQMDGDVASLFQVRGGVGWRDQISIGAYFSTSLNEITPESESILEVYMDYWSVGGFVEYTPFAKEVVHLTFPVYFGFGEVEMDNVVGNGGLGEASCFQIEPTALLEVNMHDYVRLYLGAGYRFVA